MNWLRALWRALIPRSGTHKSGHLESFTILELVEGTEVKLVDGMCAGALPVTIGINGSENLTLNVSDPLVFDQLAEIGAKGGPILRLKAGQEECDHSQMKPRSSAGGE